MIRSFFFITHDIIFLLFLISIAFSQVENDNHANDLIIGELLGKVDPEEVWSLIQTNYYPVIREGSGIEIEKVTSNSIEVIYKVHYPSQNSLIHPDRIIFNFFESEYSLIAAIITEKVDFAITESYDTAEEIDRSTSSYLVHFRHKPPNYVKMLAYNNQHLILRDRNIRKALTYAINRNYILNRLVRLQADLADGPLSKESKFHTSGLDEYKFNPRKAVQLFQSENWSDSDGDDILDNNGKPFRIAISYEKGALLDEQLVTTIKIDWNKLGVDVIRNPLLKSEIKRRLAQRNYDVVLMNHCFSETIEGFESFFKSTSKDNMLGYSNRKVDRWIELYKIQQLPSRSIMLQAIQTEINKDNPATFLFFLWLDRYFANIKKFADVQDQSGQLRPFTEWRLK